MPAVPTYTYTGNPTTDTKDAVRFTLADTNRDGLGWLLSDEEILWLVSEESSVLYAAARGAETIAAQYAGNRDVVHRAIGDLSITYGHQGAVVDWATIATMLRRRAARGAVPYGGGTNVADKITDQLNTDLLHPAFRRGQFDAVDTPRQDGGPVGSTYGPWPYNP